MFLFFFKQKTAYEMRISDWSSDVCSSDLGTGTSGAGIGLLPRGLPVEIEARPVTTICGPGIFLRLAQRSLSRGKAWTVRERLIDTLAELGSASWRERLCQYV